MPRNVRIQLDQITRANATARSVVAAAVQTQGRQEVSKLSALFESEKYYEGTLGVTRLHKVADFSKRWGAFKALNNLDPRRGHAALGIQRSFNDSGTFVNTPFGFIFDLTLTSQVHSRKAVRFARKTFTKEIKDRQGRVFEESFSRRVTAGVKNVVTPTSEYLDHFRKRKAPSLGLFGQVQRNRLKSAGISSLRQHYVSHGLQKGGRGKLKFKVLYG